MSEQEPPPYYYGYSTQNHPPMSSTQAIQVYQDWGFTGIAIQSTYPGIVQSRYPGFIGSPYQSYPELNGAPQQDYSEISETPILAHYKKRIAKGLRVTQMLLGSVIMILNIVLLSNTQFSDTTCYGIGCGISFFIAGLMCVISARYCTRITNPTEPTITNAGVLAVTIIMALMARVEMSIATATVVYCCQVLSCCKCRGSQEYRMLSNATIEISDPVPSTPLPDESNHTPF